MPEQRITITLGSKEVLVGLYEDGPFAIENRCSHDHNPLSDGPIENGKIKCTRHGATFDLKTGKNTMPAPRPIRIYLVRVDKEQVSVGYEERSPRTTGQP